MASSSSSSPPPPELLDSLTSIVRDFHDYHFCPICREKSKNPVVTPCNHQFCLACFKQVHNTRGKDNTGDKQFHCPVCMHLIGSRRKGAKINLPHTGDDWAAIKTALKKELNIRIEGEERRNATVVSLVPSAAVPPKKGKTPTKASRKEVPPVPPSMRERVNDPLSPEVPLAGPSSTMASPAACPSPKENNMNVPNKKKAAAKKAATAAAARRRRSAAETPEPAPSPRQVQAPRAPSPTPSASPSPVRKAKAQRKSANPRKRENIYYGDDSDDSSSSLNTSFGTSNGHPTAVESCAAPCSHCRLSMPQPKPVMKEMSTQTEDASHNGSSSGTAGSSSTGTKRGGKNNGTAPKLLTPKDLSTTTKTATTPKGRPRKTPLKTPAAAAEGKVKAKPTPRRQAAALPKSPSKSRGSSSLPSTEDSDNESTMNTQDMKKKLQDLRVHVSKKEEEEASKRISKSPENSSGSSSSSSDSDSSRDSDTSSSSSSDDDDNDDKTESKSVFSPTQKSNNSREAELDSSDDDMFSATPQRGSAARSSFHKRMKDLGDSNAASSPSPKGPKKMAAAAAKATNGKRKTLLDDDDDESSDFEGDLKKKRAPKKRKLISSGNVSSSSGSTLFDQIAKTARPLPSVPKSSSPPPPTLEPLSFSQASSSETTENGLRVLNPSEARRLVLLGSGIREEQVKRVEAFRKAADCTLKKVMEPSVTHLVVNHDPELLAERTLKFLQAVASGKFVVGIAWVNKCLEDDIVYDPAPFEVRDQDGDPGPERGRVAKMTAHGKLKRTGLLFSRFQFYLHGEFRAIPRGQMKRLLEDCGGVVVRSETAMSFSSGITPLILVDKECIENENECLMLFCRTDVAVVDKDWMIDCIGRYAVTSIYSTVHTHLQHEASVERLKEAGYKNEIIFGADC